MYLGHTFDFSVPAAPSMPDPGPVAMLPVPTGEMVTHMVPQSPWPGMVPDKPVTVYHPEGATEMAPVPVPWFVETPSPVSVAPPDELPDRPVAKRVRKPKAAPGEGSTSSGHVRGRLRQYHDTFQEADLSEAPEVVVATIPDFLGDPGPRTNWRGDSLRGDIVETKYGAPKPVMGVVTRIPKSMVPKPDPYKSTVRLEACRRGSVDIIMPAPGTIIHIPDAAPVNGLVPHGENPTLDWICGKLQVLIGGLCEEFMMKPPEISPIVVTPDIETESKLWGFDNFPLDVVVTDDGKVVFNYHQTGNLIYPSRGKPESVRSILYIEENVLKCATKVDTGFGIVKVTMFFDEWVIFTRNMLREIGIQNRWGCQP